jgi:hypothetical protein
MEQKLAAIWLVKRIPDLNQETDNAKHRTLTKNLP